MFHQLVLQNADPEGSGDLVVTADDGTDGSNFITIGMNGSLFSDTANPGSLPHDAYVWVEGGNVVIASNTADTYIGAGAGAVHGLVVTSTGNVQLYGNANLKFSDGTVQTTAFNQTTQANIGVLYNLIGLGNVEIGRINANLTAANAAIITANTGMKSYVDATILSNVAYTMANYQNWTSNVSSIGTALDQLASRLKAAGF